MDDECLKLWKSYQIILSDINPNDIYREEHIDFNQQAEIGYAQVGNEIKPYKKGSTLKEEAMWSTLTNKRL